MSDLSGFLKNTFLDLYGVDAPIDISPSDDKLLRDNRARERLAKIKPKKKGIPVARKAKKK